MKKILDSYRRLLTWLLVATVAILIVPVGLQMVSRFTALIPSYIWTEELSRFLLVWMIMIGAMIGVREGTHFDVEDRLSPMVIFNEGFKAYNSFILLAVPFFLLTANLMNIGGVTDRLVRLSRTMVGSMPGALAQINVVLSVFFAGISGSSTADAASQGKLFIEAQVKEGYDKSFSIAITAVSAVLAVIIPPSILMVVWGGVISTSIGALYLAGIIPGVLIALAQMATVHVYAKRRKYPVYPRATFKEFVLAGFESIPALMTPFIIVGGILLGWFTATESAAVAVVYAAVLSIFFCREMDHKHLYSALMETGKLASITLFCIGTASAFGWMLAYYKIPQSLLANVNTWNLDITGVGFLIVGVFLVAGTFLDAIPAIIIIVALAFGLVTPPYGLCLMISCAVAKVRLTYALKDTLVMLIPMVLVLLALVIWPEIALFLRLALAAAVKQSTQGLKFAPEPPKRFPAHILWAVLIGLPVAQMAAQAPHQNQVKPSIRGGTRRARVLRMARERCPGSGA
jgi:tripartite ATP-independent transporter DctM subunit